jgi:hypothetical protein
MADVAELFARDPLSLTEDDLRMIVTEMRKSRHAFNLGNVKAGSTKPKTEKQKKLSELASGGLGISI